MHAADGYPAVLHENQGYLLTDAGNSSASHSIGVFAHADVVPPGDNWLFTSPFEPIEKDGFLIGRGVYDNKAGIIMALYAAKAIDLLNIPFHSRLLIFTGSNEESGMKDIQAFAENETMPDISLVPDNGFPVCRGERGIFRWYAVSGTPFSDQILSVEGGNAFNAVLGAAKVTLRFSDEMESFLYRSVSANGLLAFARNANTLALPSHGKTGHAAHPGDAVHGIYLISDLLSKCSVLSDEDRSGFSSAAKLTKDCYGSGFGIASIDADFGTLTCVNGMAGLENNRLSLSFDCRYAASEAPECIESAVAGKLHDMGWEYRLHENSPGFMIPEDSPPVKMLLGVYESCTGIKEAKPYLSAGGTYARCLKNAFSMCDSWTPAPFDVPDGHGSAHQPDEMISVDTLLDSTAILTEMILACDAFLSES
jgi:succinyl-diaminopimelate desuccinylase